MSDEIRPDVALVTPYPRAGVRHGGNSGVASYASNLAHAMAGEGARVQVIAPAESGEPRIGHDGPVAVSRPFSAGSGALPRALAQARATGAGVIHLQHELFLYGGPAAVPGLVSGLARARHHRKAASDTGPRTVVTMHQVVDPAAIDSDYTRMHRIGVPPSAARLGIRSVQRSIRSLADAVFVHEPAFAAVVPGAVTIPHGIEAVTAPNDREAARAALGLDDRITVLCFGFVAPYKGIELAAEAAQRLGGRVNLVIAGGAHPRLEARHGYARTLEHRYADVARFTGYVSDEDVPRWFRAADVAVLPYPTPHASSGVLALALAHETPVLVSRAMSETSGLPASLGFTDVADLAARLDRLSTRPEELVGLRDTVAHLRHERGWQAVARRHLEVYDGLRAA